MKHIMMIKQLACYRAWR